MPNATVSEPPICKCVMRSTNLMNVKSVDRLFLYPKQGEKKICEALAADTTSSHVEITTTNKVIIVGANHPAHSIWLSSVDILYIIPLGLAPVHVHLVVI